MIFWVKIDAIINAFLEFLVVYEKDDEIDSIKRKEVIQNYFSVSTGKYDTMIIALCLQKFSYLNEVLVFVDFAMFQEGVALYLKSYLEQAKINLKQLESILEERWNLFFLYFKMVVYEEWILAEEKVSANLFWQSVENVILYTQAYFSESLLEKENWAVLPRNCQFAYWMKEALLCKQEGDKIGWNESIKQAAQCYPPMIRAVQCIVQEEKKKISPEMQQLADSLKENIYKLIRAGQFSAAKELVFGLEQYVPDDEDIDELKQLIG